MHIPPPVRIDEKYKDQLIEINSGVDIPPAWQNTPIAALIMAQNFGWPIQGSGKAELLIATCIEFRYALPVPRMYAYVIRRASGRVIGSEFSVGYTLAQGVKYLVLIGHNDCGMSKLKEKAPLVIDAFVEQGWPKEAAEAYVRKQATRHAIDDELGALKEEYFRLRSVFPKLIIAPLFVCLHDSRLYVPTWVTELETDSSGIHYSVANEIIADLP